MIDLEPAMLYRLTFEDVRRPKTDQLKAPPAVLATLA